MDYARDRRNKLVAADGAVAGQLYTCPRPGCGGRVFLRDGGSRRAHFAHHSGGGTEACDEYHPSMGGEALAHSRGSHSSVEDTAGELGLFVDRIDGEWRLGLKLAEIPPDELGDTSLSALRQAKIEVSVGTNVVSRISALDLRSGIGAARVPVQPTVREYTTRVAGRWPEGIDTARWTLQSRGAAARGTLFRLRRGEWTRLRKGAEVHHGEELVVLGVARPQAPITAEFRTRLAVGGDSYWTYWEVQIPDEVGQGVIDWLDRLGHTIVRRPWSIDLATPPRSLDERGTPSFWLDDKPLVMVAAPRSGDSASVWIKTGTEASSVGAIAGQSRDVVVAIEAQQVGPTQLTVVAERSTDLNVVFVERPSRDALLGQLTTTPRVRVWIGGTLIEAWAHSLQKVPAQDPLPEVRVDLGSEDARASVTVWEGRRRRTSRGLDRRNAERLVTEALSVASRIELDADNFGRIEFTPAPIASKIASRASAPDRMAWFDHVTSVGVSPEQHTATTSFKRPRGSTSLAVRGVDASALVRSRLDLRRRYEAGGNR